MRKRFLHYHAHLLRERRPRTSGRRTRPWRRTSLARFHRLRGEEVLFATGTDENAPKVAQAARGARHGAAARSWTQMAARFQQAWAELNVEYDVFIRTTEPRHRAAVQTFFRTLQDRGDIYQGPYEGWYCHVVRDVLRRRMKRRRCDGERRCPNEPLHPPLKLVQETNYFFALSRYGDRLLEHIEAHPEFLQPEFRRNEVIAFIKQGLRDVCISRRRRPGGDPGAGRPVPGHLRLVRRADQLHHGGRLPGRPASGRRSGGRRTCTWSARTSSSGSTARSGRRC